MSLFWDLTVMLTSGSFSDLVVAFNNWCHLSCVKYAALVEKSELWITSIAAGIYTDFRDHIHFICDYAKCNNISDGLL